VKLFTEPLPSNELLRLSGVMLQYIQFLIASGMLVEVEISRSIQRLRYRLDDRGSICGRGKSCFSSSQRSDRLWDPPEGTGRFFLPRELRDHGVKLTTNHHLVSMSRMMELYFHSLIPLHGVVLNSLSTGTTYLQEWLQKWRALLLQKVWTIHPFCNSTDRNEGEEECM
jgi:hypothetical protein